MSPDATIPNFVDNTKSSACGALFPTSTTMSSLGVVSPSSTKSYLISPSYSSPKLFPALSFTDTANLYFPYLVGVSTTWPFESDVHSPTLTKPSSPLSMNQVYFAETSFTPLTLSSVKPDGITSFNVTDIFCVCATLLFGFVSLSKTFASTYGAIVSIFSVTLFVPLVFLPVFLAYADTSYTPSVKKNIFLKSFTVVVT